MYITYRLAFTASFLSVPVWRRCDQDCFFANDNDKVQINLPGRLDLALLICRGISGAVQLLQLLVQVGEMRFKTKARPVQDRKIDLVDAVHVTGNGRGFHC